MFLKLFEKKYHGFITNIFLDSIRNVGKDKEKIINYVRSDLNRRKKYRKLSDHLSILELNLDNGDLDKYLDYYIKYSELPREKQKIAKKINMAHKKKIKKIEQYINLQRPLSWSAISSFEYNPKQFYDKYILNIKQPVNSAMEFGKIFGEKIASDPTYLPEVQRYSVFEKKLSIMFSDIPLIGFIDSYDPVSHHFYEYKTSNTLWTRDKAMSHGQLHMYALMLYVMYQVKPEDLKVVLTCLKTQTTGDFKTSLVEPLEMVSYDVKITLQDILKFGKRIQDTFEKMEEYINSYPQIDNLNNR